MSDNLVYLFAVAGKQRLVFEALLQEKLAFRYSSKRNETRVMLRNGSRVNRLQREFNGYGCITRIEYA